MEAKLLRRIILSRIDPPLIPQRLWNAADRGIFPGTGENLRNPLQQAVDDLSALGGGVLLLPAGVYCTGSLQLKSGVELRLDSPETRLRFLCRDLAKNYPLALSHWEASPCINYRPLLYALDARDIAVTGPGVLDGGADAAHWWNWHLQAENAWAPKGRDWQSEARKELRRMNWEGAPVKQRVFGSGHYLRPNFIQFLRCDRVLLSDFTLVNSPMWQVNPVFCRSVAVKGLTLRSHGPNNDGCAPESCDGVLIKNCLFDTGGDCISLKSGRDRDGREANTPCQNVLIENNDFSGGHGGIALGSEMSGGIRRVLAQGNRFSSPHLTYALRLKTNARRGGVVEDVILRDSVMDRIQGAAVHGTMLYEDGRNGNELPVFRNIIIENLTAQGGDWGIFLEAFPEVPITGLTLRNITIQGAKKTLWSVNWQNPRVENVTINGKTFPRPGYVRILGLPSTGQAVSAAARILGGSGPLFYTWEISADKETWEKAGAGGTFTVPAAGWVRLVAWDSLGNRESSIPYRIDAGNRLSSRSIWLPLEGTIKRKQLAVALVPLADHSLTGPVPVDSRDPAVLLAVANGFFPLREGWFLLDWLVTRQEMATVCMQSCGLHYRNASSTMPVCADVDRVADNYGTNVARALYFGFLTLEGGFFHPNRPVTAVEAREILERVANFAGL